MGLLAIVKVLISIGKVTSKYSLNAYICQMAFDTEHALWSERVLALLLSAIKLQG